MLCRGDDYRSCFAPEATFASQNEISRELRFFIDVGSAGPARVVPDTV